MESESGDIYHFLTEKGIRTLTEVLRYVPRLLFEPPRHGNPWLYTVCAFRSGPGFPKECFPGLILVHVEADTAENHASVPVTSF